MSNFRDPNLVYETGSDDTHWYSKVIRDSERFNVLVYDADGDRRPEREDSFADQVLSVAFAEQAVLRVRDRELSNYIEHPASGKTGTFAAKYDQHAERNGQTFTVLGAVDPSTYDTAECGEMFFIRFADGVQIEAWPEEVESAMIVSIYTDPNEFLLSEYSKYAEHIAEGDPMAFDDWLCGSDLPEIVKAREIAKVQERNLLKFTRSSEDSRGLHIVFGEPVTPANFLAACNAAIDLAKIECSTQTAVAIVFEAKGVEVQVTETDSAEVQLALWERKLTMVAINAHT